MGELYTVLIIGLFGNRRQKGKGDQEPKNNLSNHLLGVLLVDDTRQSLKAWNDILYKQDQGEKQNQINELTFGRSPVGGHPAVCESME